MCVVCRGLQRPDSGLYVRSGVVHDVAGDIVEEVVDEESVKAVRAVMRELVDEYMHARTHEDVTTELIDEVIREDVYTMVIADRLEFKYVNF